MRIIINDNRETGLQLSELSSVLSTSPTQLVVKLVNDYYAQYKDANNNEDKRRDMQQQREQHVKLLQRGAS